MRIAVIQDGTEATRHPHTDVEEVFRSVIANGFLADKRVYCDFVRDAEARQLLDGIVPDVVSCVVYASNALLDPSGPVAEATSARASDLASYVERGGAVIALHQAFGYGALHKLTSNAEETGRTRSRAPRDNVPTEAHQQEVFSPTVEAASPADVLLWHPNPIVVNDLPDDLKSRGLQLYWRTLALANLPTFAPVLRSTGSDRSPSDAVLARAETGRGRIVVSTIPLDWGPIALLENVLVYALCGEPRVLVWHHEAAGPSHSRLLHRQFLSRQATVVAPSPFDKDHLGARDEWLLHQVNLAVAPDSDTFDLIVRRPEVREFVRQGGSLLVPDATSTDATASVRAVVGSRLARNAAEHLVACLLARTTQRESLVFDDRNVICSIEHCREVYGDSLRGLPGRAFWEPAFSNALDSLRRRRFAERDLGSALTCAEILLRLSCPPDQLRDASKTLMSLNSPADWVEGWQLTGTQAAIRRALGEGTAATALLPQEWAETFIRHWSSVAFTQQHTRGAVVRALRAVRFAVEHDGVTLPGRETASLVRSLAGILRRGWTSDAEGWGSVQATAEIAMGLLSLQRFAVTEGGADSPLVAAASTLKSAWNERVRSGGRLAEASIVGEAVMRLEEILPSGNERIAAALSRRDANDSEVLSIQSAHATERLSQRNVELRGECRVMRQQLADVELAAYVGRVTIVVVYFGLMIILVWLMVTAIVEERAEWAALWLTVVLALLGGARYLIPHARSRGLLPFVSSRRGTVE